MTKYLIVSISAIISLGCVLAMVTAKPGYAQAEEKMILVPPGDSAPLGLDSAAGVKSYRGRKISLDFHNADIHHLLDIIGEASGKNIVAPAGLRGKVTIKLVDVPWDQALDLILSSLNFGVEESGNVLMIHDLATLQRLQAEPRGWR